MFLQGEGVDRNFEQAVKLLTLAADKGDARAQFDLAALHASGTGVKRDLHKAYSLFTLAGKTLDVSKQLSEISSELEREGSAIQVSKLQE